MMALLDAVLPILAQNEPGTPGPDSSGQGTGATGMSVVVILMYLCAVLAPIIFAVVYFRVMKKRRGGEPGDPGDSSRRE